VFRDILAVIAALGGTVDRFQFDCGERWSITIGSATWTGSYECGDEVRFRAKVRFWLDGIPWPREDDPREEGPVQ
jgi:hypothetical protein